MFWNKKGKNEAASFGIIGGADGPTAIFLSQKVNERMRILKKRGKTKLIVGTGLFKKAIKVPNDIISHPAIKLDEQGYIQCEMLKGDDLSLRIKEADHNDPVLHALVRRLDEDLLERYTKQQIFGIDFNDPKVKEMTFVIAYFEKTPVGCGGIRPLEDGSVELKRFFVDKQMRGKGIATKMLQILENKAKELGFTIMKLETGKKQPEAIALYKKAGYAEVPLYGEYLENPNTFSVCMEKKLI